MCVVGWLQDCKISVVTFGGQTNEYMLHWRNEYRRRMLLIPSADHEVEITDERPAPCFFIRVTSLLCPSRTDSGGIRSGPEVVRR